MNSSTLQTSVASVLFMGMRKHYLVLETFVRLMNVSITQATCCLAKFHQVSLFGTRCSAQLIYTNSWRVLRATRGYLKTFNNMYIYIYIIDWVRSEGQLLVPCSPVQPVTWLNPLANTPMAQSFPMRVGSRVWVDTLS